MSVDQCGSTNQMSPDVDSLVKFGVKEPVSPKVRYAPRYIFHRKIRHCLDCREVWFVSSSIGAVSDLKALVSLYWFRCIFPNSEVFSRWRRRSLNWMPHRVQKSWGEGWVLRALPKLYSWRSPCISSGGKEKHLWVSAIVLTLCLPE